MVTGEPAGCGMLGYGKTDQVSAGIHTRLRCGRSSSSTLPPALVSSSV